jgi:hypothetical protein
VSQQRKTGLLPEVISGMRDAPRRSLFFLLYYFIYQRERKKIGGIPDPGYGGRVGERVLHGLVGKPR